MIFWALAEEVKIGDRILAYKYENDMNNVLILKARNTDVVKEITFLPGNGNWFNTTNGQFNLTTDQDVIWWQIERDAPPKVESKPEPVKPRGKCEGCWSWRCPGC